MSNIYHKEANSCYFISTCQMFCFFVFFYFLQIVSNIYPKKKLSKDYLTPQRVGLSFEFYFRFATSLQFTYVVAAVIYSKINLPQSIRSRIMFTELSSIFS